MSDPALAIPPANPIQEPDSPRAPRILVIGEKFIDRYFIGTSTRLSPEAPIPVVNVKEVIQSAGGAGNVSANLKALGATVREIYQNSHYPIKNRLIASGQQIARWDEHDTVEPFDSFKLKLLAPYFRDLDGVIISDYNKGAFTPEAVATILHLVPSTTPIFVDNKTGPAIYNHRYYKVFFFPNMKEWAACRADYDQEPDVIRTESENGMVYLHNGARGAFHPALATKVVSVSGAGDSVIAGFSYYYCLGHSINESMEFASKVAAISVQKPYTATVSLEEVNNFGW